MTALFEAAGVAPWAWAAASLAVALGELTQRATGGAFGMVVAPLVALVAAERTPAGVLLVGLPVTLLSTPRDLTAIVWRELAPALGGRTVGAVAAAGVVALAPDAGTVAVLVAVSVLLGVGLSLSGLRLTVTTSSLLGAGFLSGLTGTLTSVGAPPMTLLYQHVRAERVRATLNAFFTVGIAVSMLALAARGLIGRADLWFAASMAPAAVAGFLLARPAMRALDGRSIRPLILGLAALAAAMILIRRLA